MNKVYISGLVTDVPTLRIETGEIPHLYFGLSVCHKTRAGERRNDIYRISAWNNAARWGAENLRQGDTIAIQGYLAQRKTSFGNAITIEMEITAEEMLPAFQKPDQRERNRIGEPMSE